MTADRAPRIAAVGLASWERLLVIDRDPAAGSDDPIGETCGTPGGSTVNIAISLTRLGARVAICALVGDDADGRAVRASLIAEGIDTQWLATAPGRPTDTATVIVGAPPAEWTIDRHPGARLARGDRFDIAAIFGHDVVLLDLDDLPLLRFLLDLPAHTLPATRLLGTLTHLAGSNIADALDLLLRHDAIVGNERDLLTVTGCPDLTAAIAAVRRRMPSANLRIGFVSLGDLGSIAFTIDECAAAPACSVAAVDTTGAGDAFAGAIAFGVARRWPLPNLLTFANAVASLATTAMGPQIVFPNQEAARRLIHEAEKTSPP